MTTTPPPPAASAAETVVVTLATRSRAAHLLGQREAVRRHLPGARHLVALLDDPSWEPWPGAWTVDASTADARADAAPAQPARADAAPAQPARVELARARNLAGDVAADAGACDLVFLDVDCLPGPSLGTHYRAALRAHPEAVACGPVTYLDPAGPHGYDLACLPALTRPHPARPDPAPGGILPATPEEYRLFWSLSFAVTGRLWRRIRTATGGFHEGYRGYGGEDTDFGLCLRAVGVPMLWVGGAHAYHQHHPTQNPPVQHLDDILANGAVFADRWGWWPMEGWLAAFAERGLVEHTPDGGWQRILS